MEESPLRAAKPNKRRKTHSLDHSSLVSTSDNVMTPPDAGTEKNQYDCKKPKELKSIGMHFFIYKDLKLDMNSLNMP